MRVILPVPFRVGTPLQHLSSRAPLTTRLRFCGGPGTRAYHSRRDAALSARLHRADNAQATLAGSTDHCLFD